MKLLGEIKVHKSMDHPNIVRQRDCFEDEVNVYMILDICTNGTLMDMLRARKRFTEPEVRFFGLQILGAAKYMHSRRVIHRDLKLGNLFLDENMCIKVGDFGLAALLVDDNDRKKTICGTPNYIAPEVLFASPEGHSYEVDLWSIGVIFYAMIVGKPPFQSKDVKAIYAKIKVNEYEFPSESRISASAKSLIASLLSTDPDNRPSLDDIASHRFFNSGVMPRSIPVTAVKQEPEWPEGQAASIFKRNLNFVSVNAGIGQDQCAGREQGKRVDVAVEHPERGRYLPSSLSPRTGPAAKMVNLKNERAGGRTDTLSERLNSVKLSEGEEVVDSSLTQQKLADRQVSDLRRVTSGAGALRALSYNREQPAIRQKADLDKPLPMVKDNKEDDTRRKQTESVPGPSKLRGASRVVSEAGRPITRSSRFTHLQIPEAPDQKTSTGLSRPLRRTVSSTGPTSGTVEAEQNGIGTAVLSRVQNEKDGSDRVGSSSSRALPHAQDPKPDRLLSCPVSRVASRTGVRDRSPDCTHSSKNESKVESNTLKASAADSIWSNIVSLATHLQYVVSSLPRMQQEDESVQAIIPSMVHVSKWVDYSHRYGLGYQLSNESTGVYFNDATTIILPARAIEFDFVARDQIVSTHTLEAPSKELEKKVYLLKHFRGYMNTHLNTTAPEVLQATEDCDHVRPCYMTHYWRTKAGILFRLSDGTLQLNFTDHSKLILPMANNLRKCHLRYVSIEKTTNVWTLEQALHDVDCRDKMQSMAATLLKFARSEGRGEDQ